ncbi:Phage tail protein [Enterobacter cancerogenus]|uniref:phage tail-collar fiber domain-containing protein n=1 Tax=Enterobacter cancerogenus TaxID=69218 RepID=UPI0019288643|nr:phage tail protein [Enterobacter cancerogenus]CAD5357579.1 Phage tail protein [Enterobacter cancerogenus]
MSQTAITLVFEQWKAQQATTGEPVLLDEFVFALVPGLDPTLPVERSETLPPVAQIVHRAAVARKGVVNENSVVHSAVLGADVGDFSFNWIGLMNKASGTLAMIVHAPEQQKLKTKDGQQGNVLTRSFLMEFTGAQTETAINTPAETWQIDFTARMAGMDERQRQENIDIYGAAAFFGDGWLVGKSGNQFFVTKGAGYVAGLRAGLAANQNITVTTKPVKVWLDVCWTGSLVSVWEVQCKVTVAANLADYVQSGVQHYVFALASIDANGNITDLRPKGSLDDQAASDALKEHEKSRNHPDATTGAKGFVQLSSATNSDSEALAATPKAVKAANDNANERVPSGRKVNGHALTSDVDVLPGDIFKLSTGIGDAADLNAYTAPGLYYQPANAQASTGKNYPEAAAGSLEVYKHAGITQIYRIYSNSRSYIRTLYGGAWTAWTKQYDTANKPSVGDIGAVAKAGDAMTGKLTMNIDGETILLRPKTVGAASYIISRDSSGANHWYVGAGSTNNVDAVFNNYKGGNNNVQLKTDGSVTLNPVKGKSVIANGPVQIGGIGNGILNIGDNDSGLRSSKDGQVDLWANGKMFGYWNTTTFSFTGQIIPTNYSNFDGRYYTKAQSDGGYQKKGNYVTAVRFGASAEYQERGNTERMKGGVMTSWADRGSSNYWMRVRPLQYQINGGSWVTAAYA